MSLQLSGCYLVGAVDWKIMSLPLSGCYCPCSYLVVIWLMQLIGYRCSYLVVIWWEQLIGYVVAVIWLLFGWCS